ncbi:MAG: cobalt transporter, partial [Methanoregula sp.]
SYEQGERVYISMLCRGYGRESFLFVKKKPLDRKNLAFLCANLAFIIVLPVTIWWTAFRLF